MDWEFPNQLNLDFHLDNPSIDIFQMTNILRRQPFLS